MTVDTTDVPKLSLIEQLKIQHSQFVVQREQAQNNLNQLVGAIYATEIMIKKHEDECKRLLEENSGDEKNGEIEGKNEECIAKE